MRYIAIITDGTGAPRDWTSFEAGNDELAVIYIERFCAQERYEVESLYATREVALTKSKII